MPALRAREYAHRVSYDTFAGAYTFVIPLGESLSCRAPSSLMPAAGTPKPTRASSTLPLSPAHPRLCRKGSKRVEAVTQDN